jgi:DNA-binding NtrC family response regulator
MDRIAAGAFREDLYYRINVIHVVIPPLRERRDDIEPLLRHFMQMFSAKYRVDLPDVADTVTQKMVAYDWPGNVRELKNVVERLIVRSGGHRVELRDLPTAMGPADVMVNSMPALQEAVAATPAQTLRNPAHLFDRIVNGRESFWSAVYAPFLVRDLTREDVRAIVAAGLQETRGNYKMLLDLFNMQPNDYKRFLNFLRKHHCHMPFQKFRMTESIRSESRANSVVMK